MKLNAPASIFLIAIFLEVLTLNACDTAPSTTKSISPQPLATIARVQPLPTLSQVTENIPASSNGLNDVAEVEKLAGFDVAQPAHLPQGVYFASASYQGNPSPNITLRFNLIHEQYGDRGLFFTITQTPLAQALPNPNACDAKGDACETLQVGALSVKYRLNKTEADGITTEVFVWNSGVFSFQLFRTSGEPDKIYKEELLKVIGSMDA